MGMEHQEQRWNDNAFGSRGDWRGESGRWAMPVSPGGGFVSVRARVMVIAS
jgi:hypothetical protein